MLRAFGGIAAEFVEEETSFGQIWVELEDAREFFASRGCVALRAKCF